MNDDNSHDHSYSLGVAQEQNLSPQHFRCGRTGTAEVVDIPPLFAPATLKARNQGGPLVLWISSWRCQLHESTRYLLRKETNVEGFSQHQADQTI